MIWELFGALLASRAEQERSDAEKAEMARRFFGPRRERFDDDPAQGKLFPTDGLADADAAKPTPVPVVEAEPPAAPPKKHPHGRRRFPPRFPRVRREHKLTEAERLCPCCGKLRKVIAEEDRYAQRQQHAVPLLGQFHDWLVKTEPQMLPKSKIGEAVCYALNQWEPWVRYCEAGFLSIDNNLSGQTVKPCAMGRKAWLFLGSQEGGATAAVLYSLTGSAKRNRAHPFFYLRDVLERLPPIVHDRRLLPPLKETSRTTPLTEEQRARLPGCQRPSHYLDLLRCHTRWLAEVFLGTVGEPR